MKKREGGFQKWQMELSEVQCACGCGQFISNRSAREKANGKPNGGYCQGHIWKGRTLPDSAKQKMKENHADFSGPKNPNFGKGLFGEDNPNWQGGKKVYGYINNNPPLRNRKTDLELSRHVRERDSNCVMCGNTSHLHAHHIEPWMERIDLRYDPRNCVSLCRSCHMKADNKDHKERIKPMLLAYIESIYGEKS
jgi:hypothetical protein